MAQYYDKWGRITSRFENWTTPEYYEKSDQQIRREEEQKRRKEQILVRREQLRDLMATEKAAWEKELKDQQRAKVRPGSSTSSSAKHDVDVLQRLNSTLTDQERRRREIETKLYSRWRFGMTRDDMILESKNHHQAMAKLNWLDQQVEEQLDRDRSEKEFEALEMKRQSEQLREEEIALEARKSQEREVAELKKMLEYHVVELKSREADSKTLKDQNATLKDVKLSLEIKQQEILNIFSGRRAQSIPMHNLRRLKVIVLEHCQRINEEVAQDASQLMAIRSLLRGQLMSPREEKHFQLITCKFDQELIELQRDVDNFTTMYDSEVKGMVLIQQQVWRENAETRFRLLKNIVQELTEKCDLLINCNSEEILSMVKIRESHLNAIDEVNGKLQGLNGGGGGGTRRPRDTLSSSSSIISGPVSPTRVIKRHPQQHAFMSLGEQLEGLRLNVPQSGHSDNKMEGGSPRFGKKKVAWC